MQELRRGSDQADIYCLSFDPVSKFIGVCSDKGTIHIFAIKSEVVLSASGIQQEKVLEEKMDILPSQSAEQANVGNTKSMLSFMGGILPKYFNSEWSFGQFRLVDNQVQCALKDNKIIAISCDGNYYLAEIDPKQGGECKKTLQRNLLTDEQ